MTAKATISPIRLQKQDLATDNSAVTGNLAVTGNSAVTGDSAVGWIVEVVRASSSSRQKVWSPVVLQQVKEKKAGIPV